MFRSDRGAAFASHLMSAVRAVLGVRQWDSSCADDTQHHSLIENKHKVLDATLDMAFNKGDIQNEDDLEFGSSQAIARNNLDMLTDTVRNSIRESHWRGAEDTHGYGFLREAAH